jgi:hypothetical protein
LIEALPLSPADLALSYAAQADGYEVAMADSLLPPENLFAGLPAELSRGLYLTLSDAVICARTWRRLSGLG